MKKKDWIVPSLIGVAVCANYGIKKIGEYKKRKREDDNLIKEVFDEMEEEMVKGDSYEN